MSKTVSEINEKIKRREAVVLTAEEIIGLVEEKGPERAAKEVDVVTTGTFGPMCSSGMIINIGHAKPRMKLSGTCTLNDVVAYCGFAAVDIVLGATSLPDDDPRNKDHPGLFRYGGGHVIQEFVAGKDIKLIAKAYGTDCYPRKKLETWINIKDINEATLFNPRNAYQNYNVAVNTSDNTIYTYLGILKPNLGNANYCSAGQLSPLFNDPFFKTIGIGTKIFLGGGTGLIAWYGTQHNPTTQMKTKGVPYASGGTLSVIGDLKQMKPEWLVGASFLGYGVSMTVGIGIPIPILNEEIVKQTAIKDEELFAPVVDYSHAYPQRKSDILCEVSYAQLKSGQIHVKGKTVPTASISSYSKAVEIAETLKDWIQTGHFLLSEPVSPLPGPDSGTQFKPLKERALD
ncbi:homocysteine biosynthesis protein [bacterium]|nr:homocysteine biosynthesis protein [bacterium]